MASVPATFAAACAEPGEHAQSALDPASPYADAVVGLWWFLLGLSVVVWVVVAVLALRALFAPRHLPVGDTGDAQRKRRAVAAGTAATAVLLMAIFFFSLAVGRSDPTDDVDVTDGAEPLTIEVVGHRWWWQVRYPDPAGTGWVETANEIRLPAGRRTRIVVRSGDVIHSFWVPNLHGKIDMVPGRTNSIVVQPTKTGEFRGQCAEFCGLQHAKMALLVIVEPAAAFQAWLADLAAPAPTPEGDAARRGLAVFMTSGCADCHAIRGTPADADFGPDLTDLANRRTLAAAAIPNTRGHLAGWIADPQQIKPGANMPALPLGSGDLQDLLDYLETLR